MPARCCLVTILLLTTALLSGCANQQEQVEQTGKPLNLMPSRFETRAGS
jgi:hypothetical protein